MSHEKVLVGAGDAEVLPELVIVPEAVAHTPASSSSVGAAEYMIEDGEETAAAKISKLSSEIIVKSLQVTYQSPLHLNRYILGPLENQVKETPQDLDL